jgi:hypothetical protein
VITVNRDVIDGAYTLGFDVSASGLTLEVSEGSITFTRPSPKLEVIATELERYSFPSFTFDVVPDDEFDVIYDVYLCSDNTVEVQRTELVGDTIPYYIGEKELLHLLCTFVVPPNTTSLDSVNIKVRLLDRKDEEHA